MRKYFEIREETDNNDNSVFEVYEELDGEFLGNFETYEEAVDYIFDAYGREAIII